MKKFIYVLIFPLFFLNCSFDNKTGIWKNDNSITKKKENQFKDFEKLYTQDKKFDSVIIPKNNLLINLDPVEKTFEWNEENYQLSNNSLNYFYKNLNKVTLKGKKLSSKNINDKFYYDGNNIIAYDSRGTLIIFSLGQNKIIYKFNFYKKIEK